jgi:hypothetical protein
MVMVVLARIILAVMALDSLALGVWAIARPGGLFTLLLPEVAPPHDAFLWKVLGYLSLANAGCLTIAAVWPVPFGGIALVPWVGRLLSCGMWLWLLATPVIAVAREPLWYLLGHDACGLLALTVFLAFLYVLHRRSA